MSGSVKLPRDEVDWLLRGALAAASKDDVTPVLCAVQWTIADGRVTVLATDRYRVHQLYVRAPKGTPDGEFLMDRSQADLLLRLRHSNARRLAGEVVELTWTDAETLPDPAPRKVARRYCGTLRFDIIAHDGADADVLSHTTEQVRGTFPAVGRLFDASSESESERASEMALDPEYVSAARHLRVDRGEPLRFIIPARSEQDAQIAGGSRRRPVLILNGSGTARALIQPNLMLKAVKDYGTD
ncbi:hypothetical protein [uncultured Microbacterium sp.]|uniref:hypothetical protein n=1 Tax=uncultured Microbacterium sp. TaxID=191216 RepID=UPI0025EB0F24|nr:hypothetical protein [uncultured Microbacterium sp.]